jgi:hypothetical protein
MNSSYLIQRLKKPYKEIQNEKRKLLQSVGDSFCFGGGLIRGGLSKEAWDIFKKICRFDYMGSAEFEFGAVPEAFEQIINYRKAEELIATSLPIPYYYKTWKDKKPKEGTKTVYIICRNSDKDEIIKRITNMAVGNPKCQTKERILLDEAMAEGEFAKDIAGWLELDNGYMFFIDKEMFNKFVQLFEL